MAHINEVVCLFCRKGPAQGVSVHRINAKGQPGVWACQAHIGQTDATRDLEGERIADIISGKGRP
jgi:hypothetical protein